MRESRSSGSVEGAVSDHGPYSDPARLVLHPSWIVIFKSERLAGTEDYQPTLLLGRAEK